MADPAQVHVGAPPIAAINPVQLAGQLRASRPLLEDGQFIRHTATAPIRFTVPPGQQTLLERVSVGEEITITKHEKLVARLVPFEKPSQLELATHFARMEWFRSRHPLDPQGQEKLFYRDLIDGGRKH